MSQQTSPEQQEQNTWAFIGGVVAKATVLFVLLNLVWALFTPLPTLSKLSVYNSIVPGRERLPFGENQQEAYNLSLYQLDAMFASHEINQPKADDEFRVIIIGDSSTWGTLLRPEETISGQINAAGYEVGNGKSVHVYNMGYPTLSLTKDLMILERALAYDPDMIVWMVTLESFPKANQLRSPIVQNNGEAVQSLIYEYELDLNAYDPDFVYPTAWAQTIVGERRTIADVLRLNLYGFMWASTGIDQYYPDSYEPLQVDFEPDADDFYSLESPLNPDEISLDVLRAGHQIVGDIPLLMVNEPIFISDGENSDIRYNFYYPRWIYDDYRLLMDEVSSSENWIYLDLWDRVEPNEFTNSAIHMTPRGTGQLAQDVADLILKNAND